MRVALRGRSRRLAEIILKRLENHPPHPLRADYSIECRPGLAGSTLALPGLLPGRSALATTELHCAHSFTRSLRFLRTQELDPDVLAPPTAVGTLAGCAAPVQS